MTKYLFLFSFFIFTFVIPPASTAMAAEVTKGIVYSYTDSPPIVCDEAGVNALSYMRREFSSTLFYLPEGCEERKISRFILFKLREGSHDPPGYKYVEAFVLFEDNTIWSLRYVEVKGDLHIKDCRSASPEQRVECKNNFSKYESVKKSETD